MAVFRTLACCAYHVNSPPETSWISGMFTNFRYAIAGGRRYQALVTTSSGMG